MLSKYGELQVIQNFIFFFCFYLLYLYQAVISHFTFPSALEVYMVISPILIEKLGLKQNK